MVTARRTPRGRGSSLLGSRAGGGSCAAAWRRHAVHALAGPHAHAVGMELTVPLKIQTGDVALCEAATYPASTSAQRRWSGLEARYVRRTRAHHPMSAHFLPIFGRWAHARSIYGGRCAGAVRLAGPHAGLPTVHRPPPCLEAGWRTHPST